MPIQDFYPEEFSHCYGCGRLNEKGLHIQTDWLDVPPALEGRPLSADFSYRTIAHFRPRPEHTALPGFVYGGLIASLVDCHGTGSAAAVAYYFEYGRPHPNSTLAADFRPAPRFVTASLQVSYLRPTPLTDAGGKIAALELIGSFREIKFADGGVRKVITVIEVRALLAAEGTLTPDSICARGELVAVKAPADFIRRYS